MNSRTILIFLSLLALSTAASANLGGRRSGKTGDYRPIKDLSDAHVQEIAKYAVTEHNQKDTANLEFVKVVSGESQVVAGTNYRLVIAAKDGGATHNYQAVVYERPWQHYRSLTSFNQV